MKENLYYVKIFWKDGLLIIMELSSKKITVTSPLNEIYTDQLASSQILKENSFTTYLKICPEASCRKGLRWVTRYPFSSNLFPSWFLNIYWIQRRRNCYSPPWCFLHVLNVFPSTSVHICFMLHKNQDFSRKMTVLSLWYCTLTLLTYIYLVTK